eukprot:198110-Pleurochrysis_carterae.AAC.4
MEGERRRPEGDCAGRRHAALRKGALSCIGLAEMLDEYLSFCIVDEAVVTLPQNTRQSGLTLQRRIARLPDGRVGCALVQLVDGYVPPLNGLPAFLLRLASHVDWTAEVPCFESLSRELAAFYRLDDIGGKNNCGAAQRALPKGLGAPEVPLQGEGPLKAATKASGDGSDGGDEPACSTAWTVQHVLLPAMRRSFEPPMEQAANGTVVQAACTEMLYKIFERC